LESAGTSAGVLPMDGACYRVCSPSHPRDRDRHGRRGRSAAGRLGRPRCRAIHVDLWLARARPPRPALPVPRADRTARPALRLPTDVANFFFANCRANGFRYMWSHRGRFDRRIVSWWPPDSQPPMRRTQKAGPGFRLLRAKEQWSAQSCWAGMLLRNIGCRLASILHLARQQTGPLCATGSKNDPKPGKNGNREQRTPPVSKESSPCFLSVICFWRNDL